MRILLLFATAAVIVWTAVCTPYQCKKAYDPSSYKGAGNTHVPPNCPESLNCTDSWKEGIPQGQSKALPLIDTHFVQCHEGFLCCVYVPIDSGTGEVLGHSGVTVGSGVDLGSKTDSSLTDIGVPREIIDQLVPYFGLMKGNAACAVIEMPLMMSCENAQTLTETVKNDIVAKVQKRYDRDRGNGTKEFIALPRGIRTAVADVWFQFGSPAKYPKFWKNVINNDWENAIKELRNFYLKPENVQRGDLRRRNNEADILQAALALCSRSVDVVFLVDESGSVNSIDFKRSLDFIRSIIEAFPEEDFVGERGTRFGLSLFDDYYRSEFYLSSYTHKDAYFNVLGSVNQSEGGTLLGSALSRILPDQFNETQGLRPENYGLPRILIVLTDGQSQDNVTAAAEHIRESNIVIYAIGIGNYDIIQLEAVASSPDHIELLESFSDLNEFAATLTASTCYEPQPVTLDTEIEGSVKIDSFQYYAYDVPEKVNFRAKVMDITGNTLVYASQTNPHPYKYDNDFSFTSAAQVEKIIVISPKRSTKREYRVYISVTGQSNTATYQLVGSTCDPTECSEGTNEEKPSNGGVIATKIPMEAFMLIITVATIITTYC